MTSSQPITPRGRRALRVGDSQELRGAASEASANPAETRGYRQAAQICRRESTALHHGKTISASAGQLSRSGDNRGITVNAHQPLRAAARAKISTMGLAPAQAPIDGASGVLQRGRSNQEAPRQSTGVAGNLPSPPRHEEYPAGEARQQGADASKHAIATAAAERA